AGGRGDAGRTEGRYRTPDGGGNPSRRESPRGDATRAGAFRRALRVAEGSRGAPAGRRGGPRRRGASPRRREDRHRAPQPARSIARRRVPGEDRPLARGRRGRGSTGARRERGSACVSSPSLLMQVGQLARRSVTRTLRQPSQVVPSTVSPLFLLAVNSGGLAKATSIPGFPTHSYLTFALAIPFMQGALFSVMNAGTDLARDI